jgi:hypothetical protein
MNNNFSWQYDPIIPNAQVELTYRGDTIATSPSLKNVQLLSNRLNSTDELYEALQNALWWLDPNHNSGKATFRHDELIPKINDALKNAERK